MTIRIQIHNYQTVAGRSCSVCAYFGRDEGEEFEQRIANYSTCPAAAVYTGCLVFIYSDVGDIFIVSDCITADGDVMKTRRYVFKVFMCFFNDFDIVSRVARVTKLLFSVEREGRFNTR